MSIQIYMRLFGLFFSLFFWATLSSQISNNMTLMANLDGFATGGYNDIWGYEYNGEEFAVIGSRTEVNVINVTDCSNPVIVDTWSGLTSSSWRDMKDYGDYIYFVADVGSDRLRIIRKSDYQHFVHSIASGDMFNRAHNIYIDKQHGRLYVVGSNPSSRNEIEVYDLIANPSNPPLLRRIDFSTIAGVGPDYYIHDMYVRNHIGYASHGSEGFKIWDFTDINNIQLLGSYKPNNNYNHSSWLSEDGNTAYIAYELPKGVPIEVVDVSDPYNIQFVTSFKDPLLAPNFTDPRPHNPFVNGDYLYISYYLDGLKVYDILNPQAPEFIAHYDSYPANLNYGGSGFDGNWGTYPFLPSGCILMSDISTGLYTVRLTIEPDEVIVLHNQDMVFDSNEVNFLMRDLNENDYKISIDFNTSKVVASIDSISGIKATARNADIYFDTYEKGPIIQQGGQYYRIYVRSDGILQYQLLLTLPASALRVHSEMEMENYKSGFILKDELGACWKTYISNTGELVTEAVACP